MLTKNLTPFLLGTIVTSRKPPQIEMALVVRGTFALRPGEAATVAEGLMAQGHLTAEVFHEDDDERAGECLYGGDFADYKLNAEVLLKGSCHAPGGRPVTECPVLFRVGAWSKALRVIGPRVFTEKLIGPAISEPEPFTSMRLSWANAFGGPDDAANPAGRGLRTRELPTVELAGDVIRSRADKPKPAGFGPVNPAWPARAAKRGRDYGRAYRAHRAPFYADDFDWTFFSAAPPDQQLRGYLEGDEELTLQNLHPAHPVLTARLPGIRVRAFTRLRGGDIREARMALDTLLADLDEETLVLTWRGHAPVRELDLADVKTVLVASEPLASEPLPEAHYTEILEAFERDPSGVKELMPPELLAANERLERERAGDAAPIDDAAEGLDPISAMLKRRLGGLAQAEQAKVREAMKQIEASAGTRVDLKAEAEKVDRAIADTPPLAVSGKPGVAPNVGLRRRMRGVLAQAAEARRSLEGKDLSQADRAAIEAKLATLEQMPLDPRWGTLDPTYTPPTEPLSTDEPGPGRDLSERDLTGADLRGRDLRGAKLRDAILTRADLTGAILAGADLTNAVLWKASLAGADLSGADLSRVNAARVDAEGAILRKATLEQAFFEDARLAGADLSGARGEYAVFTRADLRGAKARGLALVRADFTEAALERADLGGSSLVACLFARCRGASLSLRGADITRASFEGALLEGAALADCRGERALFMGAKLDGADMSLVALPRSLFVEASLARANLFGADLRGCRFYRATLDGAEIVRANLFSADLSRAHLNGTKLTGSSLYDAKLTGASGAGADFTGANLKRSTLERA
jgi:uncharacterized protein YjbI with pentapeptide repeats